MPGWITDSLLAIINTVPALIVPQDSPHFLLVRAMFVLIFIVLIVFAIAMLRPFCSAIVRSVRKPSTPDRA
jgi:hypothetical protein